MNAYEVTVRMEGWFNIERIPADCRVRVEVETHTYRIGRPPSHAVSLEYRTSVDAFDVDAAYDKGMRHARGLYPGVINDACGVDVQVHQLGVLAR